MESVPIVESVLVGIFVLLMIVQIRDFLTLLPYLMDSLLRARGSVALEGSIPISRIRNNISLTLLLPVVLVLYRYRLWYPSFLQGWPLSGQLGAILGAFMVYLLLRGLLYVWMKPKRNADYYQLSHKAVFTHFILFCILLFLPTVGVLALVGASDSFSRLLLFVEAGVFYFLLLLRRGQILALSCNHLRTFLYLCGLEIIPTALWVVSAIVL